MYGRVGGWEDGWMDRAWTGGRMDGWMDGRMGLYGWMPIHKQNVELKQGYDGLIQTECRTQTGL